MLAGVGHKAVAQVTQAVLRAQFIINIQATAARFRYNFAAQNHIRIFSAEQGLHLRALSARANHIRRKLVAKQKTQRFKDKALPRPGFTSQHVHAGRKLQFHVLNEGQITNAQVFKHGFNVFLWRFMCLM